ncbi:MAG: Prevent-host-death family protein [Clostridia bacterium 41_269]|nr:MAG: Prevent-host-death family protein [Clostridia bacterium 41_269]
MSKIMSNDFDISDDPVLLTPSQLVSSSKLVRSFSSYLNKAKKRPLFITREQEIEAVLISIDEYRRLLEEKLRIEELYDAAAALRRLVEAAEKEQELLSLDDVLKELDLTREELVAQSEGGGMDG